AVQMVFGELVPKNLAIAHPLATARAVTPAQRGFTAATGPLIAFLNGSANRILRAMGIAAQEELRSARSPQELSSLVRRSASEGTLAEETAGLVGRSLSFGELTAADVMTPRVRVRFADARFPVAAVLDEARRSGHSRFPVTGRDADDVVGVVHVKHALAVPLDERDTRTVAEVMAEPVVIPGSADLDALLGLLRGRGLQMAVVIDEYGGTDGVVTLEDLVEELVGDIADEHDRAGAHARRMRDGSWSLSGLLRPDEIAELTGVALPDEDEYDTLAGLVLERLGRVPAIGDAHREETAAHEVVLTVTRMDGRRIDRVSLEAVERSVPDDGEPAG
ncbi:MAG: HlyC/CorC family transporter, partial [Thermoleophilia bacterium]|nr:HlyC/CorC family transporter [Thermoleophilia bacterium]